MAVCLVVNYLTAHLHLHQFGQARRGQSLLVHGAAGGVGSATLELGRLAGLALYGTAAAENQDDVAARVALPALQDVAQLIPGAQFRMIPDVGHSPYFEAPEAFTGMVGEFLSQQGRDHDRHWKER